MRQRIFLIINPGEDGGGKLSNIYDAVMIATIIISLIPLAFKETSHAFQWIGSITVGIFILDYFLRLITADYKLKKSAASFAVYPITPMAVIDLLSILPSITALNSSFKLLRLFRLLRALKVYVLSNS